MSCEVPVLQKGHAKKLSIYVNAGDLRDGRPVHERLVEQARASGLAGATVVRGVMGYGAHGAIEATHIGHMHAHEPLEVEIVDTAEAIDGFLPEVYALVDEGMVEVAEVEVVKVGRHAAMTTGEAHMKLEGKAKMLRIFIEATDQWEGEPLHEALVKRLRQLDIAGVTVFRGLLGYGATGRVHRHKVLRHDEPMVVVVVDAAEKIARIMPAVDRMLGGGMAVLSDVDVVFYRPAESATVPG
jgi:PII-like signaling protein